jgi:hypothetical protein
MKHALALAVAVYLVVGAPVSAQMKPPTPMTAAQFAQSVPGATVTLAVLVTGRTRDTVHAELLARRDDAHYAATGTKVELFFPEDTPVVMGSVADVQKGAVLFVYAVATTRGHADVKKATVVTSYVTVE